MALCKSKSSELYHRWAWEASVSFSSFAEKKGNSPGGNVTVFFTMFWSTHVFFLKKLGVLKSWRITSLKVPFPNEIYLKLISRHPFGWLFLTLRDPSFPMENLAGSVLSSNVVIEKLGNCQENTMTSIRLMVQKSGKLTSWGWYSLLNRYLQGFGYIPGGDSQISEPSTIGNPSKGLGHCEWKSISLFDDAEIEKNRCSVWFFCPMSSTILMPGHHSTKHRQHGVGHHRTSKSF